ncbi:MAG: hypothetical protein JW768_01230 [Chitinispirillaceae bacterium]|nr:hypothetical protein [Chitinispirillaceae bacterium]
MNMYRSSVSILLFIGAGFISAQNLQEDKPKTPIVSDTAIIDSAHVTEQDASSMEPSATPSQQADSMQAATVDANNKKGNSAKAGEPMLLLRTQKDTVLLITNESEVHKLLSKVKRNVKKSRAQGYGGAGGFSHRVVAFDMEPVADLIRESYPAVSFPTLDNGFTMLHMSGGMGYAGLGNGIRIGGGGYGGSMKFVSRPYNETRDTAMTIKMDISYGGLLIEKAIVSGNWNTYLGSFIGGGSIELQKAIGKASAFSSGLNEPNELSNAHLMSIEFHGGATYTIVPWMHVGGDISIMSYFANNGFEWSSGGSFYGITPGIGIRVVFGNIG